MNELQVKPNHPVLTHDVSMPEKPSYVPDGYRKGTSELRAILATELLQAIGEEDYVLSERSFVFKKSFYHADYKDLMNKASVLALRCSSPHRAKSMLERIEDLQSLSHEVSDYNKTRDALILLKPALLSVARGLFKTVRSQQEAPNEILEKVLSIAENQCETVDETPFTRAIDDIELLLQYLHDVHSELQGTNLQEKTSWIIEHLELFCKRTQETTETSSRLYVRYTETLCALADTALAEGGTHSPKLMES